MSYFKVPEDKREIYEPLNKYVFYALSGFNDMESHPVKTVVNFVLTFPVQKPNALCSSYIPKFSEHFSRVIFFFLLFFCRCWYFIRSLCFQFSSFSIIRNLIFSL
jgi:hypothetical protein